MKKQLAAALGIGLMAGFSQAAITGVSGSVMQIAQPADARLNVLTSTTTAYAWNEAQHLKLDRSVNVDAMAPGLYNQASDLVNGVINAGTVVSSHYIHFDSPGNTTASLRGRVEFSDTIIGVIVLNTDAKRHLDDSDFLGAPTLFSKNVDARGLEFATDQFAITVLGNAIEFDLRITSPGDYIRVITVPAPGALGLASLGGFCLIRRRRTV